jgi:hypothetical protein
MRIISIDTRVCDPARAARQCTRYPQIALTPCKTCEQQIFFTRKASVCLWLQPVEKKAVRTLLICSSFPE